MRQSLNLAAWAIRNYMIYTDKDIKGEQIARLVKGSKVLDDAFEKSQSLLRDDEAKKAIADIKVQKESVFATFNNGVALVDAGKVDEAREFLRLSVQVPQDKIFTSIQAYLDVLEKHNEEAARQMHSTHSTSLTILFSSLVIALGVGTFIAWLVTRSITRPINEAVVVAETVAAGDLTSVIEINRTDETGQLLMALQKMNGNLVNIVSKVRNGTDTIATASSQIATGNLELSSRTEEQASSLEETASSMEELTSTVKQNADNARQANTLPQSASEVANKGGTVISEVVTTMESINESSKKIVDSVRQVTDIIGEISAASQEQNSGIEQIHTAITQMDQVTQQNASLVEEAAAAAAAQSLQDQAHNLSQLVSVFKLDMSASPEVSSTQGTTTRTATVAPVQSILSRKPRTSAAQPRPAARVARSSNAVAPRRAAAISNSTSGGEWEEF